MLADYSGKLGSHLPTLAAGSTFQLLPALQVEGWGTQGELVSHGSCFECLMKTEDQAVK